MSMENHNRRATRILKYLIRSQKLPKFSPCIKILISKRFISLTQIKPKFNFSFFPHIERPYDSLEGFPMSVPAIHHNQENFSSFVI